MDRPAGLPARALPRRRRPARAGYLPFGQGPRPVHRARVRAGRDGAGAEPSCCATTGSACRRAGPGRRPRRRSPCTRAAGCRWSSPAPPAPGMTDAALLVVLLLAAAACARWLLADLRTVPRGGAGGARARPRGLGVRGHPGARRGGDPAGAAGVAAAARGGVGRGRGGRRRLAGRDRRRWPRAAGAVVLPAGAPPPGWTGQGLGLPPRRAGATSGDLLLFLDADTVLAPDALAGLLELHADTAGWCRCSPSTSVVRPYEQLSAVLQRGGAAGQRRLHPPPAATPADGLRPVPADLARGLRARRRARRGARRDPRRRPAGGGLRPGRPAGAVRRRAAARSGCAAIPAGCGSWPPAGRRTSPRARRPPLPGPRSAAVLWVSVHHAVAVGAAPGPGRGLTGWGGAVTYGRPVLWAVAWVGFAWQLRSILRRIGSFRWWTWVLFPVPPARLRRDLRAVGRAHGGPALGALARPRGGPRGGSSEEVV